MALPPPTLDYSTTTYITVTSALPPLSISSALARHASSASTDSSSAPTVTYTGPVGALDDEHIFALAGVPSANPPDERALEIKKRLERLEGVSLVEIMVPKQRASRKFAC